MANKLKLLDYSTGDFTPSAGNYGPQTIKTLNITETIKFVICSLFLVHLTAVLCMFIMEQHNKLVMH